VREICKTVPEENDHSYAFTPQEKKPEPTFSQTSEVDVDVLSIQVRNDAEFKDTTVPYFDGRSTDKRSKNTKF
jgi:hypothetical protein